MSFSMISRLVVVAFFAFNYAAASAATEIASGYKCVAGSSPEQVVRTFIERGVIVAKPFEVVDAIHAFAARPGFTAFGFPLIAVLAWQENSDFFGRGPGTAPPVHFSFVVRANTWQLAKAVRQPGIKIVPLGSNVPYPQIHVLGFNSETPDALPPGADPRLAYAEVSCNPRR